MHIRCGTDILGSLVQAGVPGLGVSWADPVCEGPLPALGLSAYRRVRAAWLASRYQLPPAEAREWLAQDDRRVDRCVDAGETVLWFEADVFDQTILVALLSRLARFRTRTSFSLICIGAFPGVRRFIGLGQLFPDQLATLYSRRRPVTPAQWRLARRAWDALRAKDPGALSRLSRQRTAALRFLPQAIRRYLAEYPSVKNGLGRTAQLALETISAGAPTPAEVFLRVQKRERRPFQGDTMLYADLRDLASGPRAAITLRGDAALPPGHPGFAKQPVELTAFGRGLLAGREDWWHGTTRTRPLGGVMLEGPSPRWRFDARRGLVRGEPG